MRLQLLFSIAFVSMILIISQSPEASAGACPDEDRDGYYPPSAPPYCSEKFYRDCDDTDPEVYPGNGCDYTDIDKEVVEEKTDALKAQVQDLLENNKDANKLTKKLDNVFKALNPLDNTEENIEKLLKDTNNLLQKGKITTDEHNALITAIQTGNAENINAVLAGIDLGGKDLKRLTNTIDKLNPDLSPDIAKACKELDRFNNEVNKLFDEDKLTVTEKDALIAAAQNIEDIISCA